MLADDLHVGRPVYAFIPVFYHFAVHHAVGYSHSFDDHAVARHDDRCVVGIDALAAHITRTRTIQRVENGSWKSEWQPFQIIEECADGSDDDGVGSRAAGINALIESFGGKAAGSVSKKTTYVVAGEAAVVRDQPTGVRNGKVLRYGR